MSAGDRSFVVGTAGHVDHGKTTLIRALTGVDTDRFREEKERGLTIDIGFAHLDVGPDTRLGIVDVPGHRDFIGNMLTGSTGLDAVLLVVSAADGPMPQTREHLQIAALLGIRHGVIALTNVDRVEEAFADLAEEAVREEVAAITGHDDWPLVRVDAVRGDGIEEVRAELARLVDRLPEVDRGPVFRLPVDRSFSVAGTGTVVTGTSWSGRVEVGDRLWILPSGREARVRTLQVHGEERTSVGPRRRCALGLAGVATDEVGRGHTLVSLAAWRPVRRIGVAFELLADGERVVEHGMRLRVWLGTQEVMARVRLPGRGSAVPGDAGHAVLVCETPLVARVGDRCILRFYSPVELLGGARVAELGPPAAWTDRMEDWAAILGPDSAESLAAAVRLAGGAGLVPEELPLLTPHVVRAPAPDGADAVSVGGRWFAPARVAALEDAITAWLERRHAETPRAAVLPLESVRTATSGDDAPELVDAAIGRLASDGRVVVEGPTIRLAGHAVELTGEEERTRGRLFDAIRDGGLMPPDPAEIAGRLEAPRDLVNDLLRLLEAGGEIVRVTPELYLSADAEARLRELCLDVLAEHEPARPTDFGSVLGVTRRYLIPLLEYLDTVEVTRRTPEGRVPGSAAAARG